MHVHFPTIPIPTPITTPMLPQYNPLYLYLWILYSQKRKCHFDEILVTGYTESCHLTTFPMTRISSKLHFRFHAVMMKFFRSSQFYQRPIHLVIMHDEDSLMCLTIPLARVCGTIGPSGDVSINDRVISPITHHMVMIGWFVSPDYQPVKSHLPVSTQIEAWKKKYKQIKTTDIVQKTLSNAFSWNIFMTKKLLGFVQRRVIDNMSALV